jgi:hypothetical protein
MSNIRFNAFFQYGPDQEPADTPAFQGYQPIFLSVEQPLGDTTANGNQDLLDDQTIPPLPSELEVRTPYQPTDHTTIVSNPRTGYYEQFGEMGHVWQKEGAGAIELNFDFRVETNPITGAISADIVPVSFQPYSGGKLAFTSATGPVPSTNAYTQGLNLSGLASGLLLVTYPHWKYAKQVADAQPIPFTVPDIIPIEWPEGEAMSVNGGFLNNTVSGVDVPVPLDGGALADVYPDISFGAGVSGSNNLSSSGALLQQIEDLFVFSPSSLLEKELSAVTSNQVSGFKAGAMHNFGVVYYDKFNRSGFVNEIGNTYVEWFNKDGDDFRGDKTDPANYLNGPAAIEVKINNDPPTWAETYQIVYPGNANVSDFVQYTIGGCYPARVKHDLAVVGESETYSALPARDIDTQSKRLYVSLETLDQYRTDKNTRKDYSYTEGDKLRVISFKNEIAASISVDTDEDDLDSIYKGASDGTIIEFDVVGVEMLAKDIHNPIAHLPGGELTRYRLCQTYPTT